MSANINPPTLPNPPEAYNRPYMDGLLRVLSLYFRQLAYAGPVRASTLNINLDTLPTQADLASLRDGDVYRDNTADNVLKIKV
jgi:hypothetical protein